MTRRAKSSRPDPLHLAPLRANAKREHPKKGWYWQVVYPGRGGVTAWSGYGTPAEVTKVMADIIRSSPGEVAASTDTVTDLLDTWLGSSVDLRAETGAIKDSTRTAYEQAIKHLKPLLGTVKLYALDQRVLDAYDLDRIRAGGAKGTVHLERIVLGAAWRWGVANGICPNRALPRTSIRPEPSDKYIPSRAEVARVLQHIWGWHHVALRLQAATGARASEIGHLQIGDVDIDAGTVRIRKSKTDAREVPIASVVVEIVRKWIEAERTGLPASAALLTDAPPMHTAPALNNAIGRACDVEKVERWSTHALRYRAVIDMIDAGVDPKTACEITGHSLQTMLTVYRKVSSTGKRTAIQMARLGYLPGAPGEVVDMFTRKRRR